VLVVADSPLPRVTICVPVFNGAQWVAESLASVARQTFTDLEVLISDDASTDASARICREVAAADPRFRLVIQPARLGWMENCNWMLSRARGELVYIHGHDDILEARCIATLVAHLDVTPACCVAFSDMRAFGTEDHVLSQPSITGSPFERAYDVMAHHYNAIAFSGLMRTAVARSGLRGNDHDNFSADSTWLMRLARAGELHRVAEVLFHKRFHGNMSHFQWTQWDEDRKISAWCGHCAGILGEALAFDLTPAQQWLLVWAALQRLLLAATSLGPYQFIRDLALDRKAAMVSDFFATMSEPLRRHGWAAGDLQMTAGTAISIADALAAPYANLGRAEVDAQAVAGLETRIASLHHELAQLDERNHALSDALVQSEARAGLSQAAVAALQQSTSWRITAPLRLAREALARLQYSAAVFPLMRAWQALRMQSRARLRDRRDARVIAKSGLFDRDWYLRRNPDVAALGIDPIRHYVAYGAREGRDPSPFFSTGWYLAHYPDVAAAAINPLAHYIRIGAREGRTVVPGVAADHGSIRAGRLPHLTDPSRSS
jgi:hypothetical protein